MVGELLRHRVQQVSLVGVVECLQGGVRIRIRGVIYMQRRAYSRGDMDRQRGRRERPRPRPRQLLQLRRRHGRRRMQCVGVERQQQEEEGLGR